MTRRVLAAVSVVGIALALGVVLTRPRPAWEIASALAMKQQQAGTAIDYSALAKRLSVYLDSNPHPRLARQALRGYFALLDKAGAGEEQLQVLSSHRDPRISEMARANLRRLVLSSRPVELRLIALDGRVVDLQELRGKVVLLDFWATWCPTCMRELPNLKAIYDESHSQGFEIVGIALDDAQDRPRLLDLIRRQSLRWPQYFPGDGHYTTSDISQRFGVVGIPATFLLDRQGRVVATNLRGERLASAVRELLAKATT